MPTAKLQVKQETRVAKISAKNRGRLKAAELTEGGTLKHVMDVPLVYNLCVSQPQSGVYTPKGGLQQCMYQL